MSFELKGMTTAGPAELAISGHRVTYRFQDGLLLQSDTPDLDHPLRILPLGKLQFGVIDFLARYPALSSRARVFEPFAGCGPFGFAALKYGASSVQLLDVNPRAAVVHEHTVRANQFDSAAVHSITGSLQGFRPSHEYDLLVANPPFLPCPTRALATLSSYGGRDGGRWVGALVRLVDQHLTDDGEALICLYQIVNSEGRPLVDLQLESMNVLPGRSVSYWMAQDRLAPLESYVNGYLESHPELSGVVGHWCSDLLATFGSDLTTAYMIMHVGGRSPNTDQRQLRGIVASPIRESLLLTPADPDYLPVEGTRR